MNKEEINTSYSIGKIKWDENGRGVDEQGNVYHDLIYRSNNSIKENIKYFGDSIITINVKETETYKNLQQRIDKAIKYIENTGYGTDFSMSAVEVDNLLEILKGTNQ